MGRKNDWFGEDPVMTEAAKAIHNLVLQEKIDYLQIYMISLTKNS